MAQRGITILRRKRKAVPWLKENTGTRLRVQAAALSLVPGAEGKAAAGGASFVRRSQATGVSSQTQQASCYRAERPVKKNFSRPLLSP